jgi:hypothetical protein
MTYSPLARWAPIGGLIFVVLLVIGAGLIGDHPEPDAADQEIAEYLADGDKHTMNIIGYYFWAIGGVALLWFLSRLRGILREAEGGRGTLANLGFAAGISFIATLLVGGAPIVAVGAAIEFRDVDPATIDPGFVRVLPQMGYGMVLVGGGFAALVLVLTTSIISLQTGVLPQWLTWLGFAVAVILLFAVIFLPMIALVVWVAALAVVLLMQGEDRVSAGA